MLFDFVIYLWSDLSNLVIPEDAYTTFSMLDTLSYSTMSVHPVLCLHLNYMLVGAANFRNNTKRKEGLFFWE